MKKEVKASNTTVILICDCVHAYQDEKYGKNKRVHNETVKTPGFRCTVCGKHKTAGK